jgi:spore coat protein H
MKYAIFLFLGLNICTAVFTQATGLSLAVPDVQSLGEKNVFSFKVDAYAESKLEEISGEKYEIPSCEIAYNGVVLKTKSCKTRGQTTLFSKRKSYSISLKKPIVLGENKIKKLALNNLAMDQDYFRNRLSFLLMERIGIFQLQNIFAELRINESSAGLYLAIQKPEDYTRSQECTLLVRREYNEHFTIEDAHGKNVNDQMKRLRTIPKLSRKYEGQQLYDSLNAIVYMDHYFQWLAFNYLIKNGDYTDELFLYLTDDKRFDIIPWDYDDIFKRQPHDGFERRNKVLDHHLLFSGEEYLDMVIDRDTFLYLEFLQSFKQVLEILNPDVLKDTFEKVYSELYPYYADPEIIAQSESDQFGLTNLSLLQADLHNHYQVILLQRKSIEMVIASEIKRLSE